MTAMYPSTGSRFNDAFTSRAYPDRVPASRNARGCQRTHISGEAAVGLLNRLEHEAIGCL